MKNLHLLCNAHLDPVWLWRKPEGVGAAITTFSAAADFCETFDNFVFCHNEAVLYRWVEENDSALFARIQKAVAAGKWFIMGGWYLQPDCNMPNGESFISQIQSGIEYFTEKFSGFRRPDAAINFDSFGHTRGLVQILRDAGFTGYVCMRPNTESKRRTMLWQGFADTEIPVYRVSNAYNTLMGEVDKRLEPFLSSFGDMETGMFLWGVGNHGGGPSRCDYETIRQLQQKYPNITFIHSTPDAFFREVAESGTRLPITEDLNYVNMGCYTSMIRIKQAHQRLENEIAVAEKMAAHAALSGLPYNAAAIRNAREDLMFCQFHDILPGSCIRSAEEDAIRQLGHGIEEAQRVQLKAFLALSGAQPKAAEGEYPFLVYNPHPFAVTREVECPFILANQNWSQTERTAIRVLHNGKEIPAQLEKEESNVPLDWAKNVVFTLHMPPFSMNRVSVYTQMRPVEPQKSGDITKDFLFDNGSLRVRIGAESGLIEDLRVDGETYLRSSGALEVIQNCCDPWGFDYDSYTEKLGEFRLLAPDESARFAAVERETLCPVRIIEDGAVRTVVEALFGFGGSRAAVRYALPKNGTRVNVHIDVLNNEKDIKLKWRLHTALQNARLSGKTAFGRNELPQTGGEAVAQDYVLLADTKKAMSAIHFGTYGLDATDDTVRFTLLNSSAYSAHPVDDRKIMPDDRYSPRIDQGERSYDFELNFSSCETRSREIEAESQAAHQKPYALSYFPTGNGKELKPFITVSDSAVVLSAVRPAKDGKSTVVRLFNSLPEQAETVLRIPHLGIERKIAFKGYQFRTFSARFGVMTECDCLENPK